MDQFEFDRQETSFTCDGLVMGGYYADPEQDCQAYHVCLQVKNYIQSKVYLQSYFLQDPDLNLYPVSFLCPNGTVFNQEIFVCDWWSVQQTPSSISLLPKIIFKL